MSRDTAKLARTEDILGELAELGLMVAKELAVRLRASEDPEETVALAGAFQKMSRTVRLTLALDAKLDRGAARDAAAEAVAAREADAQAQGAARQAAWLGAQAAREAEPDDPAEVRKDRVRGLMKRLLWNESDGVEEDYEVLVEDLNARLEEAALSPDFDELPIEVLTRRLIADMGLTGRFALTLGEARQPPEPARNLQSADTG